MYVRYAEFDFAAGTFAVLLCLVAIVLLVLAWRKVRETTLVSAWCWAFAALVALAAAALLTPALKAQHGESLEAIWFAAATLTFCPVISVLGSKRPQHRAWNFIVLSLWAIIALPAVEMLLLQRGEGLDVNDARGWFLWLLALLSPINYFPTRYWFASLAVVAGQLLLLQSQLPLLRWQSGFHPISGTSWITVGVISAYLVSRREVRTVNRIDSLWTDFRNSFGLLWALRVQERVNAFIQQQGLPCALTWHGLRDRNNGDPILELPEESERMLRQTLSGLLRRFVSPAWIAARVRED